MIGVIVLSGSSPAMHGLDAKRSPSLLPLGDRPALQHIIESLVTQGITSIELIVGHAPEGVESLLGNGDRWGCNFRYHLAAQPERPYRSLKVIADIATEPWLLIHGEQYPCIDFAAPTNLQALLYYGDFLTHSEAGLHPETAWGGTAVLPPQDIDDEFANYTFDELRAHLDQRIANGSATTIKTSGWLDVSTPARLLASQTLLLDKKLSGLSISGTEREPGIWLSRNVIIHPSAKVVPPIYIGPNSRLSRGVILGPHAVIGADCIIDSNTVIEDSLVVEGSYVGESLELHKAIVSHNLLVNVRLDASIDVTEDFLLGRLDRPGRSTGIGRIAQSILAAFLVILFLPISILSALYYLLARRKSYSSIEMLELPVDEKQYPLRTYSLPCLGSDAWSVHRSAGWSAFTRQFLPGLFAVVAGRINLVGLPPRTLQQAHDLSEDWRTMYIAGSAGLITESAIASSDSHDEFQLYLADAYYSVRRGWAYDFSLVMRYFSRLIIPQHKSPNTSPTKHPDFPRKSEAPKQD